MSIVISDKVEKMYSLTPLQEGMLYLKMKDEASTQYVVQNIIDLVGNVSTYVLSSAFKLLSQRYDALRTLIYKNKSGKSIQVVLKNFDMGCNIVDLSDLGNDEQKEKLDTLSKQDVKRGFDFKKDTLMRVTILKYSNNHYKLLWTFHHIIVDGWCLHHLQNSITQYINNLISGKSYDEISEEIKIIRANEPEYCDYVNWLEKKPSSIGENYWKNYLSDYNESAEIRPISIVEPSEDEINNLSVSFSPEITALVLNAANNMRITASVIFETAWGILLQKYSGVSDVVFGKVVSGRNANINGIEKIVGMLINTIPTRINCTSNQKIEDLLIEVSENSKVCSDYDYLPLSVIQSYSLQGHNLIKTIFAFENYMYEVNQQQDSKFRFNVEKAREQTNYDISVSVSLSDTFCSNIMYNPNKFSASDIKLILDRYITIVSRMLNNLNSNVADLDILGNAEKQKILVQFNNSYTECQYNKTIVDLLEEQVEKSPNNTAIVYKNKKLTYTELNSKVNSLAHKIRKLGVTPNDTVAIMADRSIELIAGIYAIIKAGGAYVPIDPTYPKDRIEYILSDSKPKAVLVYKAEIETERPVFDLAENSVWENEIQNPNKVNKSDDLSYIIYTSGTTGKPKGVMVEHKGVVNLRDYFVDRFGICKNDNVLQFANSIFDASVWEMTMGILTGATIVVVPTGTNSDVKMFEEYCRVHDVTVATLPPQFYIQTSDFSPRLLITAGSETNTKIVQKALKKGRYINAYGPTETTVCATHWEVSGDIEMNATVPIGRPINNMQVYILNGTQLCGVGMPGELCIAGLGVARGYINSPELTSEKFIDNPFGEGKLYRSGDLAMWLIDGNIQYLGRIDEQVKIRGFRIELGEIEDVIRRIEPVKDVAVIVKAYENGDKALYAYMVSDIEVNTEDIRNEIRKKLPEYMVPSFILQIDKIPVTINGKLNKKALPEIEILSIKEYVAPRNKWEEIMCTSFAEALNIEKIGIDDDIFDFGANSITIINIVSKAARNKINTTVQNIFDYPTVRKLSERFQIKKIEEYTIDNAEDYNKYDNLLTKNVIDKSISFERKSLGNILVTGATGFLGVHVVSELVKREKGIIYCLIRGKNLTESYERFKNSIEFYFDDVYAQMIFKRVNVICGDITEESSLNSIPSNVQTVIHTAANIKHFGLQKELYSANVIGTENILKFTKKVNAKIAYISTTSVSGDVYIDSGIKEYSEQNYYVNQIFVSPYMRTKFEAEKRVLDAKNNGTDALIIRVGNLTNRYSDGKGIENYTMNRFISLISAYIKLEDITDSLLQTCLEFTPVDETAEGIVALCQLHNSRHTIFHLRNQKRITIKEIYDCLENIRIKPNIVPEAVFLEKIKATLDKEEEVSIYQTITRTDVYDLDKPIQSLNVLNEFTNWVLQNGAFEWKQIDKTYINKFINYYNQLGFWNKQ